MLPEFARSAGWWVGSFATSTDITTDKLVIATALLDDGWTKADSLNPFWVRFLGAANLGLIRKISDYDGAGQITVSSGAALSAESGPQTFEIYRRSPQLLIDALDQARENIFPALHTRTVARTSGLTVLPNQTVFARPSTIQRNGITEVRLEPRISVKSFANNIINGLNCDMEDATIGADWTVSNATITIESESQDPDNNMVFAGSQSMKVLVGASAINTVLLAVTDPLNYQGEEINDSVWVYSRVASRVSVAIQVDGDAISTGTTHSGSGWERLENALVAEAIGGSIKVGLHVTSGTAFRFYADEFLVTAGYTEQPRLVGEILHRWDEEGDFLRLHEGVGQDMNLVLSGRGLLSSVSAGTDAMEIEGDQKGLLYAYAGMALYEGDQHLENTADFNSVERRLSRYQQRMNSGVGAMASLPVVRSV